MRRFVRPTDNQSGFTLVELLVTVTIMLVLFALSSINFGQAQTSTSTATSVNTILSDIKNQQILSMAGETGGGSSAVAHGIYVQPNQYTLFTGASYSAGDGNNYTVAGGTGVTLSTTFPSGQLVFNKGDGSIVGYSASANTITITAAGSTHTITLDRFGATTVN